MLITALKNTVSKRTVAVVGVILTLLLGIGAVVLATGSSAHAADWDAIAARESSGNWSADTGNGFYGGLQFTQSTWNAYGGTGNPAHASKAEQIRIAERVLAGQGPGAWPNTFVGGTSPNAPKAAAPQHATNAAPSHGSAGVQDRVPDPQPTSPNHQPQHVVPKHDAAPGTSNASYKVVEGDTLSGIAVTHHTSWQNLQDVNNIPNPDLIFPGQTLHFN